MTDKPRQSMNEAERERLLAQFDYEIGKALDSVREGRVYDAETVLADALADSRRLRPSAPREG